MAPPSIDPLARALFDQSPDALLLLDEQGNCLAANAEALKLCGRTASEVCGTDGLALLHVENRAEQDAIRKALTAGQALSRPEGLGLATSAGCVAVAVNLCPIAGTRQAILTLRDLRRGVSQETQAELRNVFRDSPVAIYAIGLDGTVRVWNPACARVFGWREEEVVGKPLPTVPSEQREEVRDLIERVRKGESFTARPSRRQRKDGTLLVISLSAAPLHGVDGQVNGILSVVDDITDRIRAETEHKQALHALRAAEAKYHNIFEHAIEGIYQTAPDGRFLTANPMLARIYGYRSAEEMLRDSRAGHYIIPGRREEFIRELLAQGAVAGFESQIRRKDGAIIWISENARSVRDDAGRVLYFEGTVVDITERKQTEAAMLEQHSLLRSLLNSIPDLIALKDIHGVYRGCNSAFERHVGRPENEIMGKTDVQLFPQAIGEQRQKTDRQALAERHLIRGEEWLEYPNGQRVLVDELKSPFFGPNNELLGIIVIQRDITERRLLEEQLRQSQKMEAVGKLAGGVAHDFNNLLTVILGNVSLLQTGSTDAEATSELLSAIERAGWSAAELVRQLLGFSRQTVLRKQQVGLNQIALEITGMLKRTIDPRIHLTVRSAADLWPILGDPSQMNQVLMNLCLNARDAMPEGGSLTVETSNVSGRDGRPGRNPTSAAEYIRLRVADTGVGIPNDVRSRIFEPFFTTKPFGKGSGLGLALVFGIVQQHEGWLECHSEPGKGTCFDVYLPRMAQTATEGQLLCAPALPDGRPITVLLVDDELMIRELGQTWLQRLGYRVLLASDGRQAIEVFERDRERIDLIILDVVMPELSGRDVFRHIRRVDTAMPVVFSSGFSNEPVRPSEEDGVVGFIAKPYQVQDLAKAVRSALDSAGRGSPFEAGGRRNGA